MEKKAFLYEGKAKKIYTTNDPDLVVVDYKDDATAFDGEKKGQIPNKGPLNNKIASCFFELLAAEGVPSHYVRRLAEREMLVKKLEIIKVEVVARNYVAGSLSKRLGLAEGTGLSQPILEFYYKNDDLHDPLVNEYHISSLGLATQEELQTITQLALRINEILLTHMAERGIILADMKLEFGRFNGEVLLGDEISPDTCRFWDIDTREKLDKDRFRRDLGKVAEAYQEIYNRLTGAKS